MRFRNVRFAITLCVMLASVANAATAATVAEKTKTGTIQELNFADGSMIVDGYRYYSVPDTRVEIAGSYGAFTMLQVGMKVQIVYRLVSAVRRDVVEITQIPDGFMIEAA